MSEVVPFTNFPALTESTTIVESWQDPNIGGGGVRFLLPNGREVSVIRHQYSYGGSEGLFEALDVTGGDFSSYPRGWPTGDDVIAFLREVASIPELSA